MNFGSKKKQEKSARSVPHPTYLQLCDSQRRWNCHSASDSCSHVVILTACFQKTAIMFDSVVLYGFTEDMIHTAYFDICLYLWVCACVLIRKSECSGCWGSCFNYFFLVSTATVVYSPPVPDMWRKIIHKSSGRKNLNGFLNRSNVIWRSEDIPVNRNTRETVCRSSMYASHYLKDKRFVQDVQKKL